MSVEVEGGWSRRRLLGVLITAVTAAAVLIGSLGYTVVSALSDSTAKVSNGAETPGAVMFSDVPVGVQRRAEIAQAPMADVSSDEINPTEEKPTTRPDSIAIPSGVVPGPAAVLTGFPHTPEGAVGQLAAIESTVLQSMSLATAGEVYEAWALPAGTGSEAWPLMTSVRAFLDGADMDVVKDQFAMVTIEPDGAMIKGSDGADWTLACVLVTLTASLEQEVQIGYGHCEAMQWVGGRWMIAPGPPAAAAPSAWPGSPAAAEAGWLRWTTATEVAADATGGS